MNRSLLSWMTDGADEGDAERDGEKRVGGAAEGRKMKESGVKELRASVSCEEYSECNTI